MKLSKSQLRHERKAKERREKFKLTLNYGSLVIFAIASVVFYKYKPLTIGNDIKYQVFINILPIVIGVVLFLKFRNELLDKSAIQRLKFYQKIGAVIVFFWVIALLSYLTLGLVFRLAFEYTNYTTAVKNRPYMITLPVSKFQLATGRKKHSANYIYFYFEGNKENIKVSRETMQKYKLQQSTNKNIRLKIQKGIWNHYLVNDWSIISNQ